MDFITDGISQARIGEIIKTSETERAKKPLLCWRPECARGRRLLRRRPSDIKEQPRGILIVAADEKECARIRNSLTAVGMNVLFYPQRDFIFHNITASHEFEHDRLAVLSAVLCGDFYIVLTTPDAALQYTIPRETLIEDTMTMSAAGIRSRQLCAFLTRSGYARVDMVSGPGQYSLRLNNRHISAAFQYPLRADFTAIRSTASLFRRDHRGV